MVDEETIHNELGETMFEYLVRPTVGHLHGLKLAASVVLVVVFDVSRRWMARGPCHVNGRVIVCDHRHHRHGSLVCVHESRYLTSWMWHWWDPPMRRSDEYHHAVVLQSS